MNKHLMEAALLGALTLACGEGPTAGIGGSSLVEEHALPPVAQAFESEEATRVTIAPDREDVHVAHPFRAPIVEDDEFLPTLGGAGYHDVTARETAFEVAGPTVAVDEQDAPELADDRYAAGELCTFAAAAWGGDCAAGDAAACLRDADLGAVFPRGVELGQGAYTLVLTDAKAIAEALPGKADAAALTESAVDPEPSEVNALAAELVALRMNLAFSQAGSLGSEDLGSAILRAGPLAGYSVRHAAEVAEGILSGHEYGALGIHLDPAGMADVLSGVNGMAADCLPADLLARPEN